MTVSSLSPPRLISLRKGKEKERPGDLRNLQVGFLIEIRSISGPLRHQTLLRAPPIDVDIFEDLNSMYKTGRWSFFILGVNWRDGNNLIPGKT